MSTREDALAVLKKWRFAPGADAVLLDDMLSSGAIHLADECPNLTAGGTIDGD